MCWPCGSGEFLKVMWYGCGMCKLLSYVVCVCVDKQLQNHCGSGCVVCRKPKSQHMQYSARYDDYFGHRLNTTRRSSDSVY